MATKKTDVRTKGKKETAAPVPHVLLDQLHADVATIAKATQRIVVVDEDDIEISPDNIGTAVDLLGLTRSLVRDTEADYKAKVKAIVDPFEPYQKEKKTIVKLAKEAEAALESGLHGLIHAGILTKDGYETDAGCRLSLVPRRALVIDDADKIPDEYLLPREQCIDRIKLQAKLDAIEKLKAAAIEAGVPEPEPMDGVRMDTTYTFRTKLPDQLEG